MACKSVADLPLQSLIAKSRMKILILLMLAVLVVAYSGCPCPQQANLVHSTSDDKDDCRIGNMIPVANISALVKQAYKTDKDVKRTIDYIHSPEASKLLKDLLETKEFAKLRNFIFKNELVDDMGIIFASNLTHQRMEEEDDGPEIPYVSSGGMKKLTEQVMASLPLKKIFDCFHYKMKSDSKLKNFVSKIKSKEFSDIIGNIRKTEEFQTWAQELESHDLLVNDLIDIVFNFVKNLEIE